jgi:hypothetical protein
MSSGQIWQVASMSLKKATDSLAVLDDSTSDSERFPETGIEPAPACELDLASESEIGRVGGQLYRDWQGMPLSSIPAGQVVDPHLRLLPNRI